MFKKLLIGLSLLMAQACWAADTYYPAKNQLNIPSVDVAGVTYNNVVITVGDVIRIDGGIPSGSVDVYNPATNQLSISSVLVNGATYTNVVISVGQVITVGSNAPLPVYKTSYENKNNILNDNPRLPGISGVLSITTESFEQGFSDRAVAFADFFQDGSLSAITASTFYKNVYPGSNPQKWPDSPSKLYFLQKNSAGKWIDATSKLIKNPKDRYICVSTGFIEIADLNNDGKPDAVISCTGPDFTINGVFDDSSLQYLLLSQNDGQYKVSALPIPPIYAHQVALADIDGDGNVDILSVDTNYYKTPIVLWGAGDGSFKLDATKFPNDMYDKRIYGIRAIPVNGNLNIVVSGNPNGAIAGGDYGSYGTKVLQYKNGAFQYISDLSSAIPKVTSTGLIYGLALDVIYKNGYYYFLRVKGDYSGSAIVKTNAADGVSTFITEFVRGNRADTSGVFKLDSNNNFISQMSNCSPGSSNPTDFFYYQCNFSIPLK